MELKDTIKLMLSDDWRARLKGEYHQLCIRINSLEDFLNSAAPKKTPGVIAELLQEQLEAMRKYKHCLDKRINNHVLEAYINSPLDSEGL